jgi:hypothetical protein
MLDFQGATQLEKMGMAEDATVEFLKRQNLPSGSLGEWLIRINGLRSGLKRTLEILACDKSCETQNPRSLGVPLVSEMISNSNAHVCFPHSTDCCR